MGMKKVCSNCGILQNIKNFPITKGRNGKQYYRTKCKKCTSKYYCERLYTKNKSLYNCVTKICSSCKIEKEANSDNFHQRKGIKGLYFVGRCKDCIRKYQNSYKNQRNHKMIDRRKTDIEFKLRQYISIYIGSALKNNNSIKNSSCINYLDYTIDELKSYLESLFEPWMNWDNHGKYDLSNWNDQDKNTWKWNIDHIIPQSKLPYTSMNDENFKKCWSLENLRPYSAKENIKNGNRR